MSETTSSQDTLEEWVVVFQADLFTCRERLAILLEEEINAQIIALDESTLHDAIENDEPLSHTEKEEDHPNPDGFAFPTYMQIIVAKEDLEDTIEIFADIWKESLSAEGLDPSEIQKLAEDVVDLSQDTIICPGCQTEIDEITEEGECIECGLFLGFPEEEEEEEVD